MTMSKITPMALALLLGVSGAAFAQDNRGPDSRDRGSSAQDYRGDDAEEVRALDRVQLSLAEAINTAERETSGRALEATLEAEGNRIFYEVDVFADDSIKHVYIDVESGDVLDVQEDWD